jgi:hypothetical protein
MTLKCCGPLPADGNVHWRRAFTQRFAQPCRPQLKGRPMSVQTQIKTDIHKRLNAMHTARKLGKKEHCAHLTMSYMQSSKAFMLFIQNLKQKLASGEHSLPYSQTLKSKLRQIPVLL